jgi:TIR domain
MIDFFISYNRADQTWAEWIAWTLEEADYSVVIDAWDFRPGGNFALEMQKAITESRKTIAVLPESYLKAEYVHPEWAAAFAADPLGVERKLIPVRVKACQPTGLLAMELSESEAQQCLLDMGRDRLKPEQRPPYPGDDCPEIVTPKTRTIVSPPIFPSVSNQL